MLSNGARFYNDHAHPEYSTPECTTLRELVAQDKAGERILAECARRRNKKLLPEREVRLYKNNTDFIGHSYGCHDNFLMSRHVPWDRVVTRHPALSHHAPDFRGRGQDGRGGGERRQPVGAVPDFAAGGFFQRHREHRHDEPPPAHQHARRTARRQQPLPAFPRHHRRREHERGRHRAQDGHDLAGAGTDRGGQSAAAGVRAAHRDDQGHQPRPDVFLDHRIEGRAQDQRHRRAAHVPGRRAGALRPRRRGNRLAAARMGERARRSASAT